MPLIAISTFSLISQAYLALLLSTSAALAQNQCTTCVYVYVNDTLKWTHRGNWTEIHELHGYSDAWLVPLPSGSEETSASVSFAGTAVTIFGSVANATQDQPMNITVTMDSESAVTPTFNATTNFADNFDVNNQIFTRDSLPYQVHTLTLKVTGATTPFYLRGILYNSANLTPSTTTANSASVAPSVSPSSNPPSSSNDTAKLAGAIGGGVGALLLVGIIILCMIKRLRRIERNEKKLQAIPFLEATNHVQSRSQTNTYTPTLRSGGRTHPSSSTAVEEKIRLKDQSATAASSSRSFPRYQKSQSPAASLISIPSEFQHATTVMPTGTAVASSYIGTSPLPLVGLPGDAPPVPPIPTDTKYRTKSMKRREKQERQEREAKHAVPDPSPPAPTSGLGLFSNDSVHTLGSTRSTLARPLPIVPGTRSAAPSYSFPPEKIGLSPPPTRREKSGSGSQKENRSLPEPGSLPPSR